MPESSSELTKPPTDVEDPAARAAESSSELTKPPTDVEEAAARAAESNSELTKPPTDVEEAAARAGGLVARQVRSVLDAALAQGREITDAGRQQGLATVQDAYTHTHRVRDQIDELVSPLANALRIARRERHQLAVAIRASGGDIEHPQAPSEDGASLELSDADIVSDSEAAELSESNETAELSEGNETAELSEGNETAELSEGKQPRARLLWRSGRRSRTKPKVTAELTTGTTTDAESVDHPASEDKADPESVTPSPRGESSARDRGASQAEHALAGIPPPTRFLDLPVSEDEADPDPVARRGAERPCMSCTGSGECAICNGRGRRFSLFKCSNCDGSGVCPRCRGRGMFGRSVMSR